MKKYVNKFYTKRRKRKGAKEMKEFYKEIDYKLLDRKTAYKGKRIVVEELHYYNPRHDEKLYREHVVAGDAAVIMPITENNEVIMVREPRTPIKKTVLAFPAGMIEEGETAEEGALRELEEETGYRAKFIKKMTSIFLQQDIQMKK